MALATCQIVHQLGNLCILHIFAFHHQKVVLHIFGCSTIYVALSSLFGGECLAAEFGAIDEAETKVVSANAIDKDWQGLDCGPATISEFAKELEGAKTVVWNGPAGVFEVEKFAVGTKAICEMLAGLKEKGAVTIIGGGDSAAAAISMGYQDKFSHISTGGGASLEYLEGKVLPGVAAITDK